MFLFYIYNNHKYFVINQLIINIQFYNHCDAKINILINCNYKYKNFWHKYMLSRDVLLGIICSIIGLVMLAARYYTVFYSVESISNRTSSMNNSIMNINKRATMFTNSPIAVTENTLDNYFIDRSYELSNTCYICRDRMLESSDNLYDNDNICNLNIDKAKKLLKPKLLIICNNRIRHMCHASCFYLHIQYIMGTSALVLFAGIISLHILMNI